MAGTISGKGLQTLNVLAPRAQKDISIIGKFWDVQLDNEENSKVPVAVAENSLKKNASDYLAEEGFTKVLSKSQVKKLRKKQNANANPAVTRNTRSESGLSIVS